MVGSLQIMGLSSGIDFDSIINQLIALERQPITRMEERKSLYQQQQDAWRDINTRLSNLDSKLTPLKLDSTFQARETTSSDEAVATATASAEAIEGTYDIQVIQVAKAHRMASDPVSDLSGYIGEQKVKITVGTNSKTVTVNITESSTLSDVATAINNTDGIGVKASVIDDRLVLESKETGQNNVITLENISGSLFNDLTFSDIQSPQDASYTINGIDLTSSSNTISDVVTGVTFTLKGEGSTTITVSHDVDAAVDKIRAFVDQYNSVMDFIAQKTDTTMSDTGEVRSTGILQGDGTAIRLQMALRRKVTESIDTTSKYDQLAVLGITTTRDGQLEVDESKLREALKAAPEEVEAFFVEMATKTKEFIKGYIQYGTGILAEKQESLDRLMDDIDNQIERLEERVARKEESLVRQFTALEKALAAMQSQSTWLAGQLNQLVGMGVNS